MRSETIAINIWLATLVLILFVEVSLISHEKRIDKLDDKSCAENAAWTQDRAIDPSYLDHAAYEVEP